ncbi:MAG: tRNA (guanosine(37)-N1)-methyltransferase TrmD [Holosporales bacterium]|jgi:tRNA (guanine37-N1)-methyltransferase|nr:tRNA (guanosine(37)-N1)-methyltransferase TrmD [Holosporales bacterium]
MFLITVVTIFPDMFPGPLGHSLPGKKKGKIWELRIVNIRDFANNKHNKVDDTPYGGGSGMIMKPDVIHSALLQALVVYERAPKILFMTPRGQMFSDELARKIVENNDSGVVILCGRYEGVDQRVIDFWKENYGMQEISIGDYIMFGGEIPAMVVIETCLRYRPGIMGNPDSVKNESFSFDLLEYPQYTKPIKWNGRSVPPVLVSGHHKKIEAWKNQQAEKITQSVRPDLWKKYMKAYRF